MLINNQLDFQETYFISSYKLKLSDLYMNRLYLMTVVSLNKYFFKWKLPQNPHIPPPRFVNLIKLSISKLYSCYLCHSGNDYIAAMPYLQNKQHSDVRVTFMKLSQTNRVLFIIIAW